MVIRLSLQVIIMRVEDRAFDCSCKYYDTNRLLRTCAGHVDCYVEFRPTKSDPVRPLMEGFLYKLYRHHTCCYLTGSFVNYLAGNFTSCAAALLFVAMADTPLQNVIFQRGVTIPYLNIDGYGLHLAEEHPDINIYIYALQRDDFEIPRRLWYRYGRTSLWPVLECRFCAFV
jgi:hypothetical protein